MLALVFVGVLGSKVGKEHFVRVFVLVANMCMKTSARLVSPKID